MSCQPEGVFDVSRYVQWGAPRPLLRSRKASSSSEARQGLQPATSPYDLLSYTYCTEVDLGLLRAFEVMAVTLTQMASRLGRLAAATRT